MKKRLFAFFIAGVLMLSMPFVVLADPGGCPIPPMYGSICPTGSSALIERMIEEPVTSLDPGGCPIPPSL